MSQEVGVMSGRGGRVANQELRALKRDPLVE